MIKRVLPIAMLGAAFISNTGCKSNGGDFKKVNGIEYKIVKDAPGATAKMGDIVEFEMVANVDTTVLNDTRKQGRPGVVRVDSSRNKGDFQAIFPMLSVGDSAVVEISCDTILAGIPPAQMQGAPAWMKKGKKIHVTIAITAIKSMEEYKKEMETKQAEEMKKMQEKAAAQLPIDDKNLQEYFAKNNLKPEKTASGLYYTIVKKGTGENAKAGQMVSMNYTGKGLDGTVFDSNMDEKFGHKSVFTFPLGAGQVIKGWDEGVQLLNKGAKAIFYIPSSMAYGEQGPPNIGANANLIFDVEVLDIKAGGGNPQMQAAQ